MVESGFTRAKNTLNILMKNVLTVAIGAIIYFFIGFGVMFGTDGGGFIGTDGFMLSGREDIGFPMIPMAHWNGMRKNRPPIISSEATNEQGSHF